MEEDEPPLQRARGLISILSGIISSPIGKKTIILSPYDKENIPPHGLNTKGNFKRLGILNPAVAQEDINKNRLSLFPRLIYEDANGMNSCILKIGAHLHGTDIEVFDDEQVIFQAGPPHGQKGVEDLRTIKIFGENPLHGYLVHYDGFNSRTEYVRTSGENSFDYSNWDRFGIFLPNITSQKAISSVKEEKYKEAWKDHNKQTLKDIKKTGRQCFSNTSFLETKDCCSLPRKIWKDLGGGLREYYAVITRFLPDIQIIYIKGFEELANRKFWKSTIANLGQHLLLERKNSWEASHIGLSTIVETEDGFLMQYHGATMNPRNYQTGAALLDKQDPQKVLLRTSKSIYTATEPWEINEKRYGNIADGKIVFPTARIISEGIVHDFYGGGDRFVGHITITEDNLLKRLEEAA